jgi:hypothetical protein
MMVIGYDDTKGAVRIQNSQGTSFGDKGYIWMAYERFKNWSKERPATYPIRLRSGAGLLTELAVAHLVDDFLQRRSGLHSHGVAGIVVGPRDLGAVTGAGRAAGTPRIKRGSAVVEVSRIDVLRLVQGCRCPLPDEQAGRTRHVAGQLRQRGSTDFAVGHRRQRQRTRCDHKRRCSNHSDGQRACLLDRRIMAGILKATC